MRSFFSLGRWLALALAAAGSALPGSEALAEGMAGQWRAATIGGKAADPAVASTFELRGDGSVGGSAGCNRYSGQADVGDGALEIGPVAVTRMMCPPPQIEQETRFLEALATVVAWRRDADALLLLDAQGRVAIRLLPARPPTIAIAVPGAREVQRSRAAYDCEGQEVTAEYINAGPVSLAVLTIGKDFVVASNVLSGSGARYAGGPYVWWSKGRDAATLQDLRGGKELDCTVRP